MASPEQRYWQRMPLCRVRVGAGGRARTSNTSSFFHPLVVPVAGPSTNCTVTCVTRRTQLQDVSADWRLPYTLAAAARRAGSRPRCEPGERWTGSGGAAAEYAAQPHTSFSSSLMTLPLTKTVVSAREGSRTHTSRPGLPAAMRAARRQPGPAPALPWRSLGP